MFRSVLLLALVLGALSFADAAAADTRNERGVVLDRTRHTLLVLHREGDRQVYHRNRHTELRGFDRWRELVIGDHVKLHVRDAHRGRQLLARVKRVAAPAYGARGRYDERRQSRFDERPGRHDERRYGYDRQDDARGFHREAPARLRGRVVDAGHGRLVLETEHGERLHLRVTHDTRLHGIRRLRDLDDCDRLEVTFRQGRHGRSDAIAVSYLGRIRRPSWRG